MRANEMATNIATNYQFASENKPDSGSFCLRTTELKKAFREIRFSKFFYV